MHVHNRQGLETFRTARQTKKRRHELRSEIKAANPEIDPGLLERILDTRIVQDQRRTYTPKSKSKGKKARENKPLCHKALADLANWTAQ